MDYFRKIDKMRVARGWSFYRLSQESGLSQQTFTQWMNGKTTPTLPALQAVCDAFEISLAEFFAEDEIIVVTPEVKELFNDWQVLTKEEKASVMAIVKNYIKKR